MQRKAIGNRISGSMDFEQVVLIPHQSEQLEMFASRSHAVAEAMDKINDKYGESVITPALMMGMDETIIDRIAFGGVKELEELYQQ
jgi:hypothetical protein